MLLCFACKNLKQKVLFSGYKNRHEQGLSRNRVEISQMCFVVI